MDIVSDRKKRRREWEKEERGRQEKRVRKGRMKEGIGDKGKRETTRDEHSDRVSL